MGRKKPSLKQQAITLITHSGTELSKRGVLTTTLDIGQGAKRKPKNTQVFSAVGYDRSKKKRKPTIAIAG